VAPGIRKGRTKSCGNKPQKTYVEERKPDLAQDRSNTTTDLKEKKRDRFRRGDINQKKKNSNVPGVNNKEENEGSATQVKPAELEACPNESQKRENKKGSPQGHPCTWAKKKTSIGLGKNSWSRPTREKNPVGR